MGTPTIRGHKTMIKVFQDGEEIIIDSITDFSVDMDSSFSRSFFVGRSIGEGDQTVEGWSGSMNMEVRNDKLDKFIDALVNNNLNGIGVSDYTVLDTEEYADGTRSTYVYFDMQFSMGKAAKGLNDKVTKSVKFQASGRQRLE